MSAYPEPVNTPETEPEESAPRQLKQVFPSPRLAPEIIAKNRAEKRARALETLKRLGNRADAAKEMGIGISTFDRWINVVPYGGSPIGQGAKISIGLIKRHLESVIRDVVKEIPAKAKEANLTDCVNALVKVVPMLRDINSLAKPPRQDVEDMERVLRDRAAKKLAKVKKTEHAKDQ